MNIVLIEPEIPPNTGNIARLCAATGARLHLVGPLGFELSDRTLKRAGMDYWEQVEWRYWDSLEGMQKKVGAERRAAPCNDPTGALGTEAALGARGLPGDVTPRWYYVTTKSDRPYTAVRYGPDDYLVFGRETAGLPESLLKANADSTITIPMANPAARSLNLATAVAIVLSYTIQQITDNYTRPWPG